MTLVHDLKYTIMEKSSAPSSLERNGISIRGNAPFLNEPNTMVHQCTRSNVIGSLKKRDIASDRNTVHYRFRFNGELLFLIVPKK